MGMIDNHPILMPFHMEVDWKYIIEGIAFLRLRLVKIVSIKVPNV